VRKRRESGEKAGGNAEAAALLLCIASIFRVHFFLLLFTAFFQLSFCLPLKNIPYVFEKVYIIVSQK